MRAVVTGVAGFVGSHLCDHLLDCGDQVIGIDAITDYYDPSQKERNLAKLNMRQDFRFYQGDLARLPLKSLIEGADVVYHLAGQPGVRDSWGTTFGLYSQRNIVATQRLLEAARNTRLKKLVYASSSSVYGEAETYPTTETTPPRPMSPYGVTKLAAEHLCETYRRAFGLPVASLRLFTVYGPRQRPDMALARLVSAAVRDETFTVYGDGSQTRDFTYVTDVTTAMRAAALSDWSGIANVGGGNQVTLNEVIALVSELAGPIRVTYVPTPTADVRDTGADITVAGKAFGYRPETDLREGVSAMIESQHNLVEKVMGNG